MTARNASRCRPRAATAAERDAASSRRSSRSRRRGPRQLTLSPDRSVNAHGPSMPVRCGRRGRQDGRGDARRDLERAAEPLDRDAGDERAEVARRGAVEDGRRRRRQRARASARGRSTCQVTASSCPKRSAAAASAASARQRRARVGLDEAPARGPDPLGRPTAAASSSVSAGGRYRVVPARRSAPRGRARRRARAICPAASSIIATNRASRSASSSARHERLREPGDRRERRPQVVAGELDERRRSARRGGRSGVLSRWAARRRCTRFSVPGAQPSQIRRGAARRSPRRGDRREDDHGERRSRARPRRSGGRPPRRSRRAEV